MVAGFTSRNLQIGTISFIILCWGNSWNFFMLSTMSSSSICFQKSQLRADLRTLVKKKSLNCFWIYYMKTQKSTTKCRVWRDSRFKAYHMHDIGPKRTNHKLGFFGEVCQLNILVPSKIPFLWKCVFLNLILLILFFSKVGGGGGPLPLRRPWYMEFVLTRNQFCNWCWSSNYWDL